MRRRILYPAAYLAVAAAAMSIQVVGARQNAVQIDPDDIGGRHEQQGTGGGRPFLERSSFLPSCDGPTPHLARLKNPCHDLVYLLNGDLL